MKQFGGFQRLTRRRKLKLTEIGHCHPQVTSDRLQGPVKERNDKRCLPSRVYQSVARKFKTKKRVYQAAGCKEGEDHCLLDQAPIGEEEKKKLRKEYLRPRRPKAWEEKPNMWLDNYNIQHAMEQYQEAIPWFEFLGVFPMDFSAPDPYTKQVTPKCLHAELCNLKLKEEYEKGKRGIGMIFNLDPHYKGGSHWVGLYIDIHDIKKPKISYFDSYGYKTPPMIARFMRAFTLQIPDCELGFNARRFQFGDSECGMFSMYFIICMIHGIPFREFCKDSVKDGFMLELRKILFTH